MRVQRTIKTMTDSTQSEIKTLQGQEYLVVPVVAMIEGVRFGVNQSSAELGLASDFGKYPVSWNNKPLVVNHPQIDGEFVSANLTEVLEDFAFGITANARVEDGKLKMESWINLQRASELPDVEDFVNKIEADEMVEVSVGFFADVEDVSGEYKGQKYSGVWRNIVPDHLAFLTNEKGACSVEDGCGVPRINSEKNMTLKNDSKRNQAADCGCGCGGKGDGTCQESGVKANSTATSSPLDADAQSNRDKIPALEMTVQAVASELSVHDLWSLLRNALAEHMAGSYVYMLTYSVDTAVFEMYHNDMFVIRGINYDIDADGNVTFKGEHFPARVVTRVVEAKDKQENAMSTQEEKKTQGNTATPETKVEEPTTQSGTENSVPKTMSLADALKALSEEDCATVNAGLAVLTERKEAAITALQDSGRCKFSDDYLQAQSLEVLENLVELSAPAETQTQAPASQEENAPTTQAANDFAGRAVPVEPKANASNEVEEAYMPAPTVDFGKSA